MGPRPIQWTQDVQGLCPRCWAQAWAQVIGPHAYYDNNCQSLLAQLGLGLMLLKLRPALSVTVLALLWLDHFLR